MSYAMLLEKYNATDTTFSAIQEGIESLIEFVNSDVTISVDMSILEAENEEAVVKTKENFFKKIAEKVKAFVVKFAESVKNFIAKCKVAVADKGNKALKKVLADSSKEIKRPIKLKELEWKGQKGPGIIKGVWEDVVSDVKKYTVSLKSIIDGNDASKFVDSDFEEKVKTLSEDISTSDVAKLQDIKAGEKVSAVYDAYVAQYTDWASDSISDIQACYKSAQEMLASFNKGLKETNKGAFGGKDISDAISAINKLATSIMRADTLLLNAAFKILSVGVANSVKIAAAAGAVKAEKEEK